MNVKNKYKTKPLTKEKNDTKSPISLLQEELIKLCFVKHLPVRSLIFDHLDTQWLTIKEIQDLYEIIYIHLKSEHPPNPSIILNEIKDSKERGVLSGLLFDLENIESLTAMEMAKECLIRLEEYSLKNERDNLRETLKSTPEINQVIKEISDIEKKMNDINIKYDKLDKAS